MEVPVIKAEKPKSHKVDLENIKLDRRNPANIPGLQRKPKAKTHKRLRVKKMPDVMPALEQLFVREDELKDMKVPQPPEDVNEAQLLEKEILEMLGRPNQMRQVEQPMGQPMEQPLGKPPMAQPGQPPMGQPGQGKMPMPQPGQGGQGAPEALKKPQKRLSEMI